MITRSMLFVK